MKHLVIGCESPRLPTLAHEAIAVWAKEDTRRLLQTTDVRGWKLTAVHQVAGIGSELEQAIKKKFAGITVHPRRPPRAIQSYLHGYLGVEYDPKQNFITKYRLGQADAALDAARAQLEMALSRSKALEEQIRGVHEELHGVRQELDLANQARVSAEAKAGEALAEQTRLRASLKQTESSLMLAASADDSDENRVLRERLQRISINVEELEAQLTKEKKEHSKTKQQAAAFKERADAEFLELTEVLSASGARRTKGKKQR